MPNGLFGKAVVNSTDPVLIATTPSNKLRTANLNVLATAATTVDIAVTDFAFQGADFESFFNVYTNSALETFRSGLVTAENGEFLVHPRDYGTPDLSTGAGVKNDPTKNFFYTADGTTYTRIANSTDFLRFDNAGAWNYCFPDGQRRTWAQFKSMASGTSGSSYSNNNYTHVERAGASGNPVWGYGATLFKRGSNYIQYSSDMRQYNTSSFSWSAAYTVSQGGNIEHVVWMNGTDRFYLGMSTALVHYATSAPTSAGVWNNSFLTMPAGHSAKLRGGMRINSKDVLWFDDNKIATGADNTATFTYLTTWPAGITTPATQVAKIYPSDDCTRLYVAARTGELYYTTDMTTWVTVAKRDGQTTNLTKFFAVTVANSKLVIDGVAAPTLRLKRGFTYIFDQGTPSNASQQISFVDSDGIAYTTGVTTVGTPGTPGAYTQFVVGSTAPSALTYKATGGASYGTSVAITNDIVTSGALTKTVNITVTMNNNEFLFDGVTKPTLTLVKGYTYVFNMASSTLTGKSLGFRDSSSNAFTTGVTVNGTPGTSGANVTFVVPAAATDSMTYLDAAIGTSSGGSLVVLENQVSASWDNYTNGALTQMVQLTAGGRIWSREKRFFNIPANSYIEKGVAIGIASVLERTAVMVGPNEQVIVKSSADGTVVRMHGVEE